MIDGTDHSSAQFKASTRARLAALERIGVDSIDVRWRLKNRFHHYRRGSGDRDRGTAGVMPTVTSGRTSWRIARRCRWRPRGGTTRTAYVPPAAGGPRYGL